MRRVLDLDRANRALNLLDVLADRGWLLVSPPVGHPDEIAIFERAFETVQDLRDAGACLTLESSEHGLLIVDAPRWN